METVPRASGPIPLHFFLKPLLKSPWKCLGAPWSNFLTFLHQILIKSEWKMVPELPRQIPAELGWAGWTGLAVNKKNL